MEEALPVIETPKIQLHGYTTILFIDFLKDRHTQFMVKGPRLGYIRYTNDFTLALSECRTHMYDVIFHPGYVPQGRRDLEIAEAILENRSKPKLVVYHGLSPSLAWRLQEKFGSANIPLAYVPWNYDDPSVHKRLKIQLPVEYHESI